MERLPLPPVLDFAVKAHAAALALFQERTCAYLESEIKALSERFPTRRVQAYCYNGARTITVERRRKLTHGPNGERDVFTLGTVSSTAWPSRVPALDALDLLDQIERDEGEIGAGYLGYVCYLGGAKIKDA